MKGKLPGEVVICDTSKWQKGMDAKIFKITGDGVILKASEGTTEDPFYKKDSAAFEAESVPQGAYHYFHGHLDPFICAKRFVEITCRKVGEEKYACGLELGLWVDVETRPVTVNKVKMEGNLYKFIKEVHRLTGIWAGIYTRKTFWDANLPRNDWAKTLNLWLAAWPYAYSYEKVPALHVRPELPADWAKHPEKLLIWQYEGDKNGRGFEMGANSSAIDFGRFMGTLDQFRKTFNLSSEPEPKPDPKPDPTPEPRRFAVVGVDNLNIRSAPIITPETDFGSLHLGKKFEVIGESGDWLIVKGYVWKRSTK